MRFPLIVAALAVLAACSMATVENQSLDEGVSRAFNAAHKPIAIAIVDSLRDIRFEVTKIDDNSESIVVLFVRPVTMSQWGGAGRAVITKNQGEGPTAVTINYTRRFGVNGAGPEGFSRTLFARVEGKLSAPAQ